MGVDIAWGLFRTIFIVILILFIVSLPMVFFVAKKKYGVALFYLPFCIVMMVGAVGLLVVQ